MEDNSSSSDDHGDFDFSRISLRPFDLTDIDDFMEWAADDQVNRFSNQTPYFTREVGLQELKYSIFFHPWSRSICLDNRSIGSISVSPPKGKNDMCRAEIGYSLGSSFWGKGIATHVVRLVATSVFWEWPHLERLEALVDVENVASQRVVEKVGFQKEGVLRKYFIVKGYYSMYGHVEKLAEKIREGAASIEGVEAKLFQVAETLSDEVLGKMSAPPKSDVPIISANELAEADGFVFGFPTRYGMMTAQFKAFFDATGGLWRTQQLAGKPAGIFFSTGSQGGGQETTALTAITQLVHHGMIFVPIGYTFGAGMFEMEQVKGGSPYGAGTFAGDGSRQPTALELEQAFHQGKIVASVTKKLKGSA